MLNKYWLIVSSSRCVQARRDSCATFRFYTPFLVYRVVEYKWWRISTVSASAVTLQASTQTLRGFWGVTATDLGTVSLFHALTWRNCFDTSRAWRLLFLTNDFSSTEGSVVRLAFSRSGVIAESSRFRRGFSWRTSTPLISFFDFYWGFIVQDLWKLAFLWLVSGFIALAYHGNREAVYCRSLRYYQCGLVWLHGSWDYQDYDVKGLRVHSNMTYFVYRIFHLWGAPPSVNSSWVPDWLLSPYLQHLPTRSMWPMKPREGVCSAPT